MDRRSFQLTVAKTYPQLDEALTRFIREQSVFFVATAPLAASGHVNLSPKGLDTFRILGPTSVAYLDIFGSGVETIAHLRENGRIVVMFCAFQGATKVLRLHGHASKRQEQPCRAGAHTSIVAENRGQNSPWPVTI